MIIGGGGSLSCHTLYETGFFIRRPPPFNCSFDKSRDLRNFSNANFTEIEYTRMVRKSVLLNSFYVTTNDYNMARRMTKKCFIAINGSFKNKNGFK